jgi:hypothetical protein
MTAAEVGKEIGAKKHGNGKVVRSKGREPYFQINAGPIVWPKESFWRVGICDHTRNGIPCEVDHLRCADEMEAAQAVAWLAACAKVRRSW